MTDDADDPDSERDDDIIVAPGAIADRAEIVTNAFPPHLLKKFEIASYRNAATILRGSFPSHFIEILKILDAFAITVETIRRPGGSKGPVARYVDGLFDASWRETRIAADLKVSLHPAKGKNGKISEYVRAGYLDGHRIDFLKGRVAVDLEWNSKDQTYDRDLYAFSAFYDAGAIDVGVIITRGVSMNTDFFRSLGPVLKKDGTEGTEQTYKKFGASTTWMGKLLYRLEAGRNGGCPILAVGITPACVTDWQGS